MISTSSVKPRQPVAFVRMIALQGKKPPLIKSLRAVLRDVFGESGETDENFLT